MKLLLKKVALPLLLVAWSVGCSAQTKVTIGYTGTNDPLLTFAAKDEGFFANHQLDATPQQLSNGSVVINGLVSNSIQIGSLPASVVLQAIDGGIDLVFIAGQTVTEKTDQTTGTIARNGTDIKAPKDFIGKRVGVSGIGSISQIFFRQWLIKNGIDYKKVRFVESAFSNHADAIKSGNVDALVTAEPVFSRIVESGTGYPVVYFGAELPEGIPLILYAATREWAEKNPAAIKAFRASLEDSRKFADANPAKDKLLLSKYLKLTPEVAAKARIPKFDTSLSTKQIQWWIDAMVQQEMFRATPSAAKVILP